MRMVTHPGKQEYTHAVFCRRRLPVVTLLLVLPIASSCRRSTDPTPPPPAPGGIVTITPAGLTPVSLEIPLGARVLVINNDTRARNITSDPHPEHDDCPALNQVGTLEPGQRRETGNFVAPGVCQYHDHDLPTPTLFGSITIK